DVADDADAADVGAAEDAIVADLLNAGAGLGDDLRELCQAAGAVADRGDEAGQAAVGGEADFDHAAQDERIDVAAAQEERDGAASQLRKLAAEQGGEWRGRGAFDDALFQLD